MVFMWWLMMREAKTRKHELTRVRKANKLAKTERSKDKRADNAVIRKEMNDTFIIRDGTVYTWVWMQDLVL